ncbi:MAG: transposase [Syntrophomonas sp.]|nr:transposase [Syntrophomonas sp.]
MPRNARQKSENGIYHIMVRGINRQDIFHDDEDQQRYLETIARMKKENRFEVYGFCLMTNHVHLLVQEKEEEISRIMKRIGISYAWWYNSKYNRVGHLFQDRYKSEGIDKDAYLLSVIRYIHKNPVMAGMVEEPEEFRWSSCRVYYGEKEYPVGLTDTGFILGLFANNELEAVKKFKQHMKAEHQDTCLDDNIKLRLSDIKLVSEIKTILNGEPVIALLTMEKKRRNEILKQIKLIEGSTQRQIARVTGLNQSLIFKA